MTLETICMILLGIGIFLIIGQYRQENGLSKYPPKKKSSNNP